MVNLTPLDIQQQRFKTRFRGFDIQEVDVFLDQMADAFESLLKQNEKLKEEIIKNAVNLVKVKFSTEKMLENYDRIYQQVL